LRAAETDCRKQALMHMNRAGDNDTPDFDDASQADVSHPVKSCVEDLAIFGGKRLFTHQLHVGRPNIGDRGALLDRIQDILNRKWLTNNGPYLQQFEQHICELIGVKHCVAVCNATIGLEILAKAMGLSGEVIIPSFTFAATAHALRWLGVTPVFCDVDRATHNIDPQQAEKLITARTSGIIGVHVWGRPCNVDALVDLARRHKLTILFDAAHAFACSHKRRMIGGFGDAEIFSFHATKFINTFEGGAVVTNKDELVAKLRLMRNFGFTGLDAVACLGTNGKMNEVCAAMGLNSIASLDTFIEINRRHYDQYRRQMATVPGISLALYDECERNNFQYIVLEIDEEKAGIGRDALEKILWAENVLARRYFYPGCHRMEPYRTEQPTASSHLPNTQWLIESIICLPTGSAVTSNDVASICALVGFVIKNAAAVQEQLAMGGFPVSL
jgi:dTDP-4-amino-4,6-dideoxygalactose transaminase